MFTFSLSSAFATIDWTSEGTSKSLTEPEDYYTTGGNSKDGTPGDEGITEAYRAELISEAGDMLDYIDDESPFYAPEEDEAISLIEAYIEDLKTVKTAEDADELKETLEEEVGIWEGEKTGFTEVDKDGEKVENPTTNYDDVDSLKLKATVRAEAADTKDGIAADGDDVIDITTKARRADYGEDLWLPGYATLVGTANSTATKNVVKDDKNVYTLSIDGTNSATAATLFGSDVEYDKLSENIQAVVDWFMDNDYREDGDCEDGAKALKSALVIVDSDLKDDVEDEKDAISDEIEEYKDKAEDLKSGKGLPISDLEGIDALVKKVNDFNDKYDELIIGSKNAEFDTDTKYSSNNDKDVTDLMEVIAGTGDYNGVAINYFEQYDTEISALPEKKNLTDADRATVIELYNKVNDLLDSYEDTWDFVDMDDINEDHVNSTSYEFVDDYDKVEENYEYFLKEDVKDFDKLDDPSVYEKNGNTAYFDNSEKNVNKLTAKRDAFDALVSNYGYDDLNDIDGGMSYREAAKEEAQLLAAEHNKGADTYYDDKDYGKVQSYLNNATVKVTTKALGNKKIRVQATIDAESFKDIVDEADDKDLTIEYKFYKKKASAASYKGYSDRTVSNTTFIRLSKGTKYNFKCAVIVKDIDGNVVASKSYLDSTKGVRTAR